MIFRSYKTSTAPEYIEADMVKTMPTIIRFMAERLTSLLQSGKPIDIAEAKTFPAAPGAAMLCNYVVKIIH